jgi:hypothetical protein
MGRKDNLLEQTQCIEVVYVTTEDLGCPMVACRSDLKIYISSEVFIESKGHFEIDKSLLSHNFQAVYGVL